MDETAVATSHGPRRCQFCYVIIYIGVDDLVANDDAHDRASDGAHDDTGDENVAITRGGLGLSRGFGIEQSGREASQLSLASAVTEKLTEFLIRLSVD